MHFMQLKTLSQLKDSPEMIHDQTVLVRVDYNVPLAEENGRQVVKDDQRILNSLDTINLLLGNNNRVILLSHLGRPKGIGVEEKYSLRPVYDYLLEKGWWDVFFSPEVIGDTTRNLAQNLQSRQVLLLENLRFDIREKQNDPSFVSALAELGTFFVNEAFSSCHRAHASVFGLPQIMSDRAFAGLALESEVTALEKVIDNPLQPLVVVVGGAKISDKVDAVANLARVADVVLVGGGVANNFIKAEGVETHKSYMEDVPVDLNKDHTNYVEVARRIIDDNRFERYLKDDYIPLSKIVYPIDVIAGKSPEETLDTEIIQLNRNMPDTEPDRDIMYLDIGPRTTRLYQEIILAAGTVFWNGPVGVFENKAFSTGTSEVARAIAKTGAMTVIGGGDTIAAAKAFEYEGRVDFVSTGGSAGLEFLAGKKLPGLAVLELN